jgi:2-methylaconitate cis-trans-isomerase PrpF
MIVLFFSAFSCAVALPFFIFQLSINDPQAEDNPACGGTFAALGQFAITAAYS